MNKKRNLISETNSIKKYASDITLDNVMPHAYKPQLQRAQIRQVITTTYPSVRAGNSESDFLPGLSEFNLEEGQSYESTRVTWISVPNGATEDQVKTALSKVNQDQGVIYQKISYNVLDVLTEEQIQAINSDSTELSHITEEFFQEKYRVKRSDGTNTYELEGRPMYKQNFFSAEPKMDEDYRVVGEPETGQVERFVDTETGEVIEGVVANVPFISDDE